MKIIEIYYHRLSHFFDDNFVKLTFILNKLLRIWFHEILLQWEEIFRFSTLCDSLTFTTPTIARVRDEAKVTTMNSATSMQNAKNPPNNIIERVWINTDESWNPKASSDAEKLTPEKIKNVEILTLFAKRLWNQLEKLFSRNLAKSELIFHTVNSNFNFRIFQLVRFYVKPIF